METEFYNTIVNSIKTFEGLSKDCLEMLKSAFPTVYPDALHSMVSNEYQKRMKLCYVKTPETVQKYYDIYAEAVEKDEPNGIIIRMARITGVCPCLIARLILQKPFMYEIDLEEETFEISEEVKTYLSDTSLIPDSRLAYEVYLCTLYDDLYSPVVELMKMNIGDDYEHKLEEEMFRLGITFKAERGLRNFGFDKTPDVKLDVPVSVNGFMIHWVESKARFGDEEVHEEYFKSQLYGYVNRFGSGLVIYWFGFMKSIVQTSDDRLMIQDHFPPTFEQKVPPSPFKDSQLN